MLIAGLSENRIYKALGEIGLLVGGYTTLGGVVGLVWGTVAGAIKPLAEIDLERCVQLSAAVMGLFSLCVEIFSRAGV